MSDTTDTEFARQRALDAYRIVDTLPEAVFDDVARLASMLCDAPIALVSLVDRDRQWFKAAVGLQAQQTARQHAVCDHAIRNPETMFEVSDLAADARFAANPIVVDGPRARFYAGMPLVTPGGQAVGTVCVLDREPRSLDPSRREALASLARLTMNLLESRRRELEHERAALLQAGAVELRDPAASTGHYTLVLIEVQAFADAVRERGERAVEKALQQLDARLAELLPAGGSADRATGSPEFIVVLPAEDADAALRPVHAALAGFERETGLRLLAGIASTDHGEPVETVFLRADEALSRVKSDGATGA